MRCSESNRVNRAASITTKPKRCLQDVASRPAGDTDHPRASASPLAKHEAPIAACQPLRRGAPSHVSRRWREGGPFTAARRRPGAAHRHGADHSCPRLPRHPRGPHGGSRRRGARRWRRRIDWRTAAASERRRPLSGSVPEVSPVLSAPGPDAVRMTSKIKKTPPTAMILGNESPRWRNGAGPPRGAEIARLPISPTSASASHQRPT